MLTNAAQHHPWYQGLLQSTLIGFDVGVGGSFLKSAWTARGLMAAEAEASGGNIARLSKFVGTLPAKAKAFAVSDAGKATAIAAGFFIPAGYTVWGAATFASDRR